MTALAVKHDAVNLGPGAPDFDGPEFLKEAAIKAIRDGRGQYARMTGLPELTSAIAQRFMHTSGVSVDPEREIVVTCGATEAILDCMLALLEPGDEVLRAVLRFVSRLGRDGGRSGESRHSRSARVSHR